MGLFGASGFAVVALVIGGGLCDAGSRQTPARRITVFSLNERYEPQVNLEPLEPLAPAMRAILAFYAMRGNTGCPVGEFVDVRTYRMQCQLTTALRLGDQCSDAHVALVREWFKDGVPPIDMSVSGRELARKGDLKAVCNQVPDTATRRSLWDVIRVERDGDRVTVRAILSSTAGPGESDSYTYETVYQILPDRVKVASNKKTRR